MTGRQSITLADPAAAALPRTFIYCSQDKEHDGADARWRHRKLNTGHVPIKTAPQKLAEALLELT